MSQQNAQIALKVNRCVNRVLSQLAQHDEVAKSRPIRSKLIKSYRSTSKRKNQFGEIVKIDR